MRSWEEGESLPGLENLELIGKALGLSLEQFLLHLRGLTADSEHRYQVAEDVLPIANHLPPTEKLRLIQLLAEKMLNRPLP